MARPPRAFADMDPTEWVRIEFRAPAGVMALVTDAVERFDVDRDQVLAELVSMYLSHYIENTLEARDNAQ